MKRIALILAIILMADVAWAVAPYQGTSATTMLRITDGIGWQYKCISSSIANTYGFGGVGDTLDTDSTVSRGTLMAIKRIKESSDAGLAELLPIFIQSRTCLDSSYLYAKWSGPCWGLNNFYSAIGGLNGWQSARPDSGRFSPYFARVARANGVYLTPKAVFPAARTSANGGTNLGSALFSSDSTLTYSDSLDIDSTLYGPVRTSGSDLSPSGNFYLIPAGCTGTGVCSLVVYGANQSLVHGRTWRTQIDSTTTSHRPVATVAHDSIYSIDSVKARAFTSTFTGAIRIYFTADRADSL